ncbi:patatin-like phospholipase family protein [bacterium]|nr:patatin-like phospholipase family protein [bacterium]
MGIAQNQGSAGVPPAIGLEVGTPEARPAGALSQAEPGAALCLSGGGFRATLYHLGCLIRLNEFGYLSKLKCIVGVSGGAIAAAQLACKWHCLGFNNEGQASKLIKEVVDPLRVFCCRLIDLCAIGEGFLPFYTVGEALARRYDRHLFKKKMLAGVPQDGGQHRQPPRFIFLSTNFQTGSGVQFRKDRIEDQRVGVYERPDIPLSAAVAAASAFPPMLSPFALKGLDPKAWKPIEDTEDPLHKLPDYYEPSRKKLILTDGGVFDNFGVTPVLDKKDMYNPILVSDAAGPTPDWDKPRRDWPGQLVKLFFLSNNIKREVRRNLLVEHYFKNPATHQGGTLWRIGTRSYPYGCGDALSSDPGLLAHVAATRTRLNPFSPTEQGYLINTGYAFCDAAMRKFVLHGTPTPEPRLPLPDYPLDDEPPQGLRRWMGGIWKYIKLWQSPCFIEEQVIKNNFECG